MGVGLVERTDDLIVVKQLPVIEDRLDEAYQAVAERLKMMSGLVVTEDNYKELKKTRADLNKEFSELEGLRKRVKAAVEAPYKKFEAGAYKRLADEYQRAIGEIDGNIKDVEDGLKTQRRDEVVAYWEEYRQSLGLDVGIADFKKSGLKIGLSGTMKSLKGEARARLDEIDGDLKMIDTLENADEVLAEYRERMNVTEAVRAVNERHKRIEEEKVRREAMEEERRKRDEHVASVVSVNDGWAAPAQSVEPEEVADDPQILTTKYLGYEVKGTLEQLKGLKGYLQEALMEYCEMEGLKYGAC